VPKKADKLLHGTSLLLLMSDMILPASRGARLQNVFQLVNVRSG